MLSQYVPGDADVMWETGNAATLYQETRARSPCRAEWPAENHLERECFSVGP